MSFHEDFDTRYSFLFRHPEFQVPNFPISARCTNEQFSRCSCIKLRVDFNTSKTSEGMVPVSLRSIKISVAQYWNTPVPENADFLRLIDWNDVQSQLVIALGWKSNTNPVNFLRNHSEQRLLASKSGSSNYEKQFLWKQLMCCMIHSNGIPSFYQTATNILENEYSFFVNRWGPSPRIINDHWRRTPEILVTVKYLDRHGFRNEHPEIRDMKLRLLVECYPEETK